MQSIPALYYFDTAGIAEPIRLCFVVGGVDFKDVRLPHDESWVSHYKKLSPSGKAPWLEVNDKKYVDSQAILLYAARLAKLMPTQFEDCLHAAAILDASNSRLPVMREFLRGQYSGTKDQAAFQQFCDMAQIDDFEKLIGKNQGPDGHIVGDQKLTYIDIHVATLFEHLRNHFDVPESSLTNLKRVHTLVYNLKAVKQWQLTHPKSIELRTVAGSFASEVLPLILRTVGLSFQSSSLEEKETGPEVVLNLEDLQAVSGLTSVVEWINARCPLLLGSELDQLRNWSTFKHVQTVWHSYASLKDDDLASVAAMKEELLNLDGIIFKQTQTSDLSGNTVLGDCAVAALHRHLMSSPWKGVEIDGLINCERISARIAQLPSIKQSELCRVKPELYYFDIPGKAESIRYLLAHAKKEFKDIRFNRDEWFSKYKAMSPTGQCPMVKIGSEVYVETIAIMKYFAGLLGYEPCTARGKLVADSVASALDLVWDMGRPAYTMSSEEAKAYRKTHVLPVFDKVEKVFASYKCSGCHVTENRLTWIDLLIAGTVEHHKTLGDWFVVSKYPHISEIYNYVSGLPSVMDYKSKRETSKGL